MKAKILKIGNKLGIYFPKSYSNFKKGELIEIKIIKNLKENIFLTKFNQNVIIRKPAINYFNLNKGEIINIELKKVNKLERTRKIFKNNKIDLLALIPEQTSNNYEIFINKFKKDNEERLRVWYCHERGSGKQLEIKRFIDVNIFGRLLGQLQAEGTKSGRRFRLEFSNQLIQEHIDYINYLTELGIPKNLFICQCDFHPNVKDIDEKIKDFEIKTGFIIKYIVKSEKSKGSYGFKTYIRSTLLTEIILNSLDVLRKKLVEEFWDDNLKNFANAFFAKLLTGDGTLDITTKNRQFNFPETRIKITDGNIQYLKDYAEIMKKLRFKPHINEKHISVRAYAGFDKLLYLYKIKAFYNTPNWTKLIFLIDSNLKGRRLKTFLRFLDFLKSNEVITSRELVRNYNIGLRAANDWLNNKEKDGLLVRINKNRPLKWKLTKKAEELESLLSFHKQEFISFNADKTSKVSQPFSKNN